jgi:Chromo (CHRromatin Organisation MOdifier) domain
LFLSNLAIKYGPVWLDTRNLKTTHHKKIGPKREGPFEITKVIGPGTYQLKLPTTWKIHNVFHATLLQQYKETEVYGANFSRPPLELIREEEVYEVDNILRHRKRSRRYEYYVKWKGYPILEASWEPENVFSNDGDLLTHYKERHQL